MVAQLQDVEDALAGFFFNPCQFVEQLGGGHQRFFGNNIAAQAQAGSDVRVVQVVGGADGDIVERGSGVALELVGMIKEAFKFGKKCAFWRDAVDDADRVIDVISHGQAVAGVFDGVHVARSDIAGSADQGKVFHVFFLIDYRRKTVKPAAAASWRSSKLFTSASTGLAPRHNARSSAGVA